MTGIYNAGNFDVSAFSKITVVKYYGGNYPDMRFSIGGISRRQGDTIDVSNKDKINYEIFNGHSNYDWYQLELLFE